MREFSKYKRYYTVIELSSFILLIVFGIISLIGYFSYPVYDIFEFFQTPSFIITIISAIIFLVAPSFIKILALKGAELMSEMRIRSFKSEFFKNFKDYQQFDFEEISHKYNIKINQLQKIFEEFLAKGFLKGELVGSKFYLAPNFKLVSFEEGALQVFKENIIEYVKPYRWLNIPKTAKYFHVPVERASEIIADLIHQKKIIGFLDGDSLVREMSVVSTDFTDLPECPYCDAKNLSHSIYCCNCGKQIDFDKVLRETESDLNTD